MRVLGTTQKARSRGASSFLEVQIAVVLLGVSTAALAPVMVTQMRQSARIQSRFPTETVQYISQPDNPWVGKLGGRATLSDTFSGSFSKKVLDAHPDSTVDDLDLRYYEGGLWSTVTNSRAYNGDLRRADPSAGASLCLWEFYGIRPQYYEILVTWPAHAMAAPDAQVEIYDAITLRDTIVVNQTQKPAGETSDGVKWQSLGLYWIDTGSIWVVLWSQLSGNVLADAVRIKPAQLELDLTTINRDASGQTVSIQMTATPQEP